MIKAVVTLTNIKRQSVAFGTTSKNQRVNFSDVEAGKNQAAAHYKESISSSLSATARG